MAVFAYRPRPAFREGRSSGTSENVLRPKGQLKSTLLITVQETVSLRCPVAVLGLVGDMSGCGSA